ncbi:CoA transferase [Saccharothrix variisporea]|uniref:CoA transferase n=1 Tax=Saccharothrix variisporea TaxID=543527 RepID=UPI001FEBC62E|nr:CoA transferase [Saccharothrix variisporea]
MDAATEHAWTWLGGTTEAAVEYEYVDGVLPARLPVRELARATVGVCSLAAAELLARRNGVPRPRVRVHEGAVATAFVSERHVRVNGREPTVFAPLSRFWRAADGWVRTHANYPHHRERLLHALDTTPERLEAVIAARPAEEVQEVVYAAGGLAVAVVDKPLAPLPLVEVRNTGTRTRTLRAADLPAAGVRVLDLTRVIAGPVATRTLGLLGADVLRIDAPSLPEDDLCDTGFGKRSALRDLAVDGLDDLLDQADVVVTGYRPGALDRFGLAPEALLERRPSLVVAQLDAWGWTGPWASRRGFDSLVQAGSGIAAVESDGERPGVLPAQALDHGTGYLLAAAVLRALADGTGRHIRLSLAGTASWLLHDLEPGRRGGAPYASDDWVATIGTADGELRHALPPVHYEGCPRTWAGPPTRWGDSRPEWNAQ